MSLIQLQQDRQRHHHVYAGTLSAIVHLGLVFGLRFHNPAADTPIEVSLLTAPPAAKELLWQPHATSSNKKEAVVMPQDNIIAPPSDVPASKAPENAAFLSDKDTSVAKQTVRRGTPANQPAPLRTEPVPAPPKREPPAASAAKEARAGTRETEGPGRANNLRLDSASLLQKLADSPSAALRGGSRNNPGGGEKDGKSGASLSDPERTAKLADYQPFHRNDLDALFSGRAGVPDFLPQVPDGELTMLNAKADRNAVFVRRVALQVFGALRRMSWADIPFGALQQAHDFVTVRSVLSPQGKLLHCEISGSSGARAFDQVLLQAAKQGSWDQNPPSAAFAADGNIHFTFQARTWARAGAEGYRENRWLLEAR